MNSVQNYALRFQNFLKLFYILLVLKLTRRYAKLYTECSSGSGGLAGDIVSWRKR